MHSLFVYGTLLDPHIQTSVFGKIIEGKSDLLFGYKVIQKLFKSGIYPAIVHDGASITTGKVLQVNDHDLQFADLYEGDEYKRVTMMLESGINAWVYVPANSIL
jgi:gamma-glutamylcyclotransferase (GGCT)/AIG2-like uncharacterized protein YtfP